MKKITFSNVQESEPQGFDLVRLTKSKDVVDLCPNTLREYNKQGLPFYRKGKVVFFSKAELLAFIREAA